MEDYVVRELAVLKNLMNAESENIVGYLGAYNEVTLGDEPNSLYIITEFCQGGDLLELLKDESFKLGWKFRIKLALEAASAINYIHENNIIHRDIKSQVMKVI